MPIPTQTGIPRIGLSIWNALVTFVNGLESAISQKANATDLNAHTTSTAAHGATSTAAASTVVRRDAGGGTNLTVLRLTGTSAPAADHAVTRSYIDALIGSNAAPTAAFTVTGDNLVVQVDGSGSTDPDGTIASYRWVFGDGTTGAGVATSHTYTAPGGYTITLTVTDTGGATATTTRSIIVTAPEAGEVARDAFTRTVASGWGTAEVGGSWLTTAEVASVSAGAGHLTLSSAGAGAAARLADVVVDDATMQFRVSVDKIVDASGVYVLARARTVMVDGVQHEYRYKVQFLQTGTSVATVTAWWAVATGGPETALTPESVITTSYAAGDVLVVKAGALGTGPTRLLGKAWPAGTTEPAVWLHDLTDTTPTLQAPGSVGVYAVLSTSATVAPVDVAFDDLTAVSGTVAPTQPRDLLWWTDYADPTIATTGYGPAIGAAQTWDIEDPEDGWPDTDGPRNRGGFQVPTDTTGTPRPERGVIVRGADVPTGAYPAAIRMEQQSDERYLGRARTEVHNGIPLNPDTVAATQWPLLPAETERHIRLRFYIPTGHVFATDTTWETITQLKGWEGGGSPWPSGSPPVSLSIDRDGLLIDGKPNQMVGSATGPLRPYADTSKKTARRIKTLTPGWHDIVLSAFLSDAAARGWVQVYEMVNGAPVERYPRTFAPTLDVGTDGTAAPVYLKEGIYRSTAWTVDHTLWFADTLVGRTLASVTT